MKTVTKILVIFSILATVILILPLAIPLPKAEFESIVNIELPTTYGKYLVVDDYSVYVEDMNPESTKVITFIHGFGGSTYTWRNNMRFFAESGYRVIAMDLKGFGLSQKGLDFDYSHAAQADLIKGVLDRLNITKTTLVGHSMGGNVVAFFTQRYPEFVDKLVLVDAGIIDKQPSILTQYIGNYPFKNWVEIGMSYYFTKDRFADFLKSAYVNKDVVTDSVIDTYYKPLQIAGWQDSLVGITRDGYKNVLPMPLSSITTPTLIIWGEKDPWTNIGKGNDLNSKIEGSTFKQIQNSGHLPMEEYPNEFNDTLLAYLKGTDTVSP